jgi:hypothetical protein
MRGYVILAVGCLALTFLYGELRHKAGQAKIVAAMEKARVISIEQKREIDNEISKLSDDELLRRALGYVSRNGR